MKITTYIAVLFMILLSSFAKKPDATDVPSPSEKPPIEGMWDDGLVGENTMLALNADGTGHIVSRVIRYIQWEYQNGTRVLTLRYIRERDQRTFTNTLEHSPESDTLVGKVFGSNDVFRRAHQEKIDWWNVLSGPTWGVPDRVVITRKDEVAIQGLVAALNKDIEDMFDPISVNMNPHGRLRRNQYYRQLLDYDAKLLPYLIRQGQIKYEGRVFVGSELADREIASLEDLHQFQAERKARLKKGITPWVNWPWGHWKGMYLLYDTSLGSRVRTDFGHYPERKGFSWLQWWEDNKHKFVFETQQPVTIDTTHKFHHRPHVSTETTGELLTLEAVRAPYRQIIERAAAELGVEVFIGESERNGMHLLGEMRMREVTFEEFVHLMGHKAHLRGFEYQKIGDGYHFGGKYRALPRINMDGWGIAMESSVFSVGEDIPITIVTREIGEMIHPSDPVFSSYGSFRITDNAGNVIKDYLPQAKKGATIPLFQKEKDCTEIDLIIEGGRLLKPGEYNTTFRYLENETPSIAFEVYPTLRQIRWSIEQPGGTDTSDHETDANL